MAQRIGAAVGLLVIGALFGGCGPSAHLVEAQQTISVTGAVVADAEVTLSEAQRTAGSETLDDAAEAYRAAAGWQRRIESMVSVWESEGSGEMGYRLYAGCLRGALRRLKEAYEEAELSEPEEVEQSIELLAGDASEECADPDE